MKTSPRRFFLSRHTEVQKSSTKLSPTSITPRPFSSRRTGSCEQQVQTLITLGHSPSHSMGVIRVSCLCSHCFGWLISGCTAVSLKQLNKLIAQKLTWPIQVLTRNSAEVGWSTLPYKSALQRCLQETSPGRCLRL